MSPALPPEPRPHSQACELDTKTIAFSSAITSRGFTCLPVCRITTIPNHSWTEIPQSIFIVSIQIKCQKGITQHRRAIERLTLSVCLADWLLQGRAAARIRMTRWLLVHGNHICRVLKKQNEDRQCKWASEWMGACVDRSNIPASRQPSTFNIVYNCHQWVVSGAY